MITYRKVGGLHFFKAGPYRVSFCRVKRSGATRTFLGVKLTQAELISSIGEFALAFGFGALIMLGYFLAGHGG